MAVRDNLCGAWLPSRPDCSTPPARAYSRLCRWASLRLALSFTNELMHALGVEETYLSMSPTPAIPDQRSQTARVVAW